MIARLQAKRLRTLKLTKFDDIVTLLSEDATLPVVQCQLVHDIGEFESKDSIDHMLEIIHRQARVMIEWNGLIWTVRLMYYFTDKGDSLVATGTHQSSSLKNAILTSYLIAHVFSFSAEEDEEYEWVRFEDRLEEVK